MAKNKKPYMYVLSIDAENGDGADWMPIREKSWKKDKSEIDRVFSELLFSTFPPPKVEVKAITKAQWEEAKIYGISRA